MNLSLRDVEYFLAAVDHGNLARAAASCAVSQPALSKSLKRLEADTGLVLFDRASGRSIQLTSSGLVFLEHARKLWAEYRDAVRHAGELRVGQAGLLRIGATGATLDTVVLPALAELLPRRPALRADLQVALSDDLRDRIEKGALDLAIAPVYVETPSTLVQEPIKIDDLSIVASRRHALAVRRKLKLADLADYRWVLPDSRSIARKVLDARFDAQGLGLPQAALEVSHFSAGALRLIANSNLLAALPSMVLALERHSDLVSLPVTLDKPLWRQIVLLSRREAIWSPLMSELRNVLLAMVKPMDMADMNRRLRRP
ncbi:LysR family transcriptional regulator [Bordetella sp. FB-8]|uniref:LysR family transcriptional regulator n=1 Tax=Bordetella sp. FB-8 TaxID=1159870 RepID=UPI0003714315|nr:LysR family transcriptional regulator [Bordetella sp. FB-8]